MVSVCETINVYEDEGGDQTRPVWFTSAADPVSALLSHHLFFFFFFTDSRSVATAEGAPAVKHLLAWHRGARPGPLVQDSLRRGVQTS